MNQVLAVLQKYTGMNTYTSDIHTNVVGGLNVQEPATDLALAVAIASSIWERPVPQDMAFIGELGRSFKARLCSAPQREQLATLEAIC